MSDQVSAPESALNDGPFLLPDSYEDHLPFPEYDPGSSASVSTSADDDGLSVGSPQSLAEHTQSPLDNGDTTAASTSQGPAQTLGSSWVRYTIPGGQGYPFMLEANMRNLHLDEFLLAIYGEKMKLPYRAAFNSMRRVLRRDISSIRPSDLRGDSFDIQGIPWNTIGISRQEARRRRLETFQNHTNIRGADKFEDSDDTAVPVRENFFRFRRMDALYDTQLAHFQLRNLLACPNRTQAFYPTGGGLRCINPLTGFITPALRMTPQASFSCITAGYGMVMAGALNGSYSIRRLEGRIADTVEGSITRTVGGGANHLEMYSSRGSDSPHVGICSNDSHFRVMDLRTQAMLSSWESDGPFNCSSISKDGRIRAMMGDLRPVAICDATSGVRIQTLTGHRDYGFACAWSDDGWTLATGNQDKKLCIWDARKWCDSNGHSRPLTTIKSEMAGVRCLRFSPVGSGKPVLAAAEDADFINIIDAQTYNSKQTMDFFGNIGGLDFTNEGRDLNVFCCDPMRGSLMQLERCEWEVEPLLEKKQGRHGYLDLKSDRDRRPMASRETPYKDLVPHYFDVF